MNAVEIEQAITTLAERPFDAAEFPFAFLEAFGNKPTTMKRLRKGASNKSDLGGVLQTGHIHILVAEPGRVPEAMEALRASPATLRKSHKVRFILATDGRTLEAEALDSADAPIVCDFADMPNQFGFFRRWPASRPSRRSARTPSTSGPRRGSTSSTSSCWRRIRTGARTRGATTSTTSSRG